MATHDKNPDDGYDFLNKNLVYIHVKYPDDDYYFVKKDALDTLIESNNIVEFKRSTGWVRIGVDPIRKTRRDQRLIQTQDQRRVING